MMSPVPAAQYVYADKSTWFGDSMQMLGAQERKDSISAAPFGWMMPHGGQDGGGWNAKWSSLDSFWLSGIFPYQVLRPYIKSIYISGKPTAPNKRLSRRGRALLLEPGLLNVRAGKPKSRQCACPALKTCPTGVNLIACSSRTSARPRAGTDLS